MNGNCQSSLLLEKNEGPNQSEVEDKKRSKWFLWFAVITACLFPLSSGMAIVWTSPVVEILKTNDTQTNPIRRTITTIEISWITSLYTLGLSLGPMTLAKLLDIIGRKWSQIFVSTLELLGFLILAFGNHIYYYYFARLLQGLCAGFMITALPLYIGEISETFNRGRFATFPYLFITIGNLSGYLFGSYFSIRTFTLIFAISPLLNMLLLIFFIPESPVFLAMKNKRIDAEKSLRKYLSVNSSEAHKLLLEIENLLQKSLANRNTSYLSRLLTIKKSLFIGLGISVIQSVSGIFVIVVYLQSILAHANVSISPSISVISFGVIQLFMAMISAALMDLKGRRFLLLTSLSLIISAHSLLGTYFILQQRNFTYISNISWLPIASLILYIVAYGGGVGPVSFVIKGEIYPPDLKTVAAIIAITFLGFLNFVMTFTFHLIRVSLGIGWCFVILAACNALGLLFTYFYIPEMKGKRFLEIQEMVNWN